MNEHTNERTYQPKLTSSFTSLFVTAISFNMLMCFW